MQVPYLLAEWVTNPSLKEWIKEEHEQEQRKNQQKDAKSFPQLRPVGCLAVPKQFLHIADVCRNAAIIHQFFQSIRWGAVVLQNIVGGCDRGWPRCDCKHDRMMRREKQAWKNNARQGNYEESNLSTNNVKDSGVCDSDDVCHKLKIGRQAGFRLLDYQDFWGTFLGPGSDTREHHCLCTATGILWSRVLDKK